MNILKKFSVLLFGIFMATVAMAGSHQSTDTKTITQIALSNKNFSTLVTALKAAGLAKVLNQPGEYTVFAPTNEAFAKLPKATLMSLLKPENKDKLKAILLYHVVKDKVSSGDVKPGMVKTLEGQDIKISMMGDKVMLNNSAQVINKDINASNGVIHVINAVILPPKK